MVCCPTKKNTNVHPMGNMKKYSENFISDTAVHLQSINFKGIKYSDE
jgi:hypothetical protein